MVASDSAYHQQNLQIHGVFIAGSPPLYSATGCDAFRYCKLKVPFSSASDGVVPMKLPVVPQTMSPYELRGNRVLFAGEPLTCFEKVQRVREPPEEDAWHMKGYTLPFAGTPRRHHELRINLRITGACPGRCFFCHRWHSHRLLPDARRTYRPADVLDRLAEAEGEQVFRQIDQVMLICELFGREDRFLQAVAQTAQELDRRGYAAERSFGCCAHDVRSAAGLRRLHGLVRPLRYSASLEFFHDREQGMGRYKGLPLETFCAVLERARRAGFVEIQLNYMAGIDSLEECASGFARLKRQGLVDSVGLSTYTCFSQDQLVHRHPSAWDPSYYLQLAQMLRALGIKAYRPRSYDMGTPYAFLLEEIA